MGGRRKLSCFNTYFVFFFNKITCCHKKGEGGGREIERKAKMLPIVETLVETWEKLAKESESSGVIRTSTEVPFSGTFEIVKSIVKLP